MVGGEEADESVGALEDDMLREVGESVVGDGARALLADWMGAVRTRKGEEATL